MKNDRLTEEKLKEIELNHICYKDLDIQDLISEIRILQKEVDEQCRLNGIGVEREAKFQTENEQLKKDIQPMIDKYEKLKMLMKGYEE